LGLSKRSILDLEGKFLDRDGGKNVLLPALSDQPAANLNLKGDFISLSGRTRRRTRMKIKM